MIWSYGITTVRSRRDNVFRTTLASLKEAGFDKPHIFLDGGTEDDYKEFGLPMTIHSCNIRTAGHWILSLIELYTKSPNAHLFAMFQDDFVTYKNLRQYLETFQYPTKGYLNLYTFPENQDLCPEGKVGWFKSNQFGKGAVALVFDRETITALLGQPYMWLRFQDEMKGHRNVDGGVISAMRNVGFTEYVHNPSLVQHIGKISSMGNSEHAQAPSFRGVDFDAMSLKGCVAPPNPTPVVKPPTFVPSLPIQSAISKPAEPERDHFDPPVAEQPVVRPVRKGTRVGMVGYSCLTGLGELSRQLIKYASIDAWLIRPHPRLGVLDRPDHVHSIVCPLGQKLDQFLNMVDIVVFAEVPHYQQLIGRCKELGKKTVCIPMLEWLPDDLSTWPKDVDHFICPTLQSKMVLEGLYRKVDYFPWPIDLERFQYRQRQTCERFVFINGNGGWHGRKGGQTIRELIKAWPEVPLTVYDQTHSDWIGLNVISRGSPKENHEMYAEGDVLLSPHTVDGLSLEPLEAAASGMPIVMTNGQPWNEYPAIARLDSEVETRRVARAMPWHTPSVAHLASVCRDLIGQDLSSHSEKSRAWAERRNWQLVAAEFDRLVRS